MPSLVGTFELDGNATQAVLGGPAGSSTTPSHDWNQVFSDNCSNGTCSIAKSPKGTTSGTVISTFLTDPANTASDDTFTGASSTDTLGIQQGPWLFASSKPLGRNDISHAYTASYLDPGNNHQVLYAGLDRYDNSGTATAGFWYLKNAIGENPGVTIAAGHPFTGTHADGDLLLISDATSAGSSSALKAFRWAGDDSTGSLVALNGGNPISGNTLAIVNSARIPVPWTYTSASGLTTPPAGTFLEAGVDLTALGQGGCFASFLAETRSSQSPTATLADLTLGNFPVCHLTAPAFTGTSEVGASTTYALTVHNDSGIPLYLDKVSDSVLGTLVQGGVAQAPVAPVTSIDASGCLGSNNPLQPGASCTLFVTRTVQPTDPDPTPNTVTFRYNSRADFSGDAVSASGTGSVNLFQPSATLRVAAAPSTAAVGDSITYTYTINNTSSIDSPHLLLNTFSDPFGTLPPSACNDLAPGASCTFTVTRAVQPSDPIPLVVNAAVDYHPAGYSNAVPATASTTVNVVAGSLRWRKVDGQGNPLGGATFQVCATGGTAAGTGYSPLCVLVQDNDSHDADPANGQFLLKPYQSFGGLPVTGLPLGTYTVQETLAPDGYTLDPTVRTVTLSFAAPSADLSSTPFVDVNPTVVNTNNSGPGSLRQAILDANSRPGLDRITFAIPAGDPHHYYYKDDGVTGKVSLATRTVAVKATGDPVTNDEDLLNPLVMGSGNIGDPDYPHSWWSIQPTSRLDPITDAVYIDGYSQGQGTALAAQQNTLGIGPGSEGHLLGDGDNAILRIELSGEDRPQTTGVNGLTIDLTNSTAGRSSTVRGLVVNRFVNGIAIYLVENIGSIVAGNFIGSDVSGTLAPDGSNYYRFDPGQSVPYIPAAQTTMYGGVWFIGGSANIVGTDANGTEDAGERNVLSATNFPVVFYNRSTDNSVAGNFIGTNRDGRQPAVDTGPGRGSTHLGNLLGVAFINGSAADIGRTGVGPYDASRRNLISGNYYGASAGNASNGGGGAVSVAKIRGNWIGTDITGHAPLGNMFGVTIFGSSGNPVGPYLVDAPVSQTDALELGNVIAFNHGPAVSVADSSNPFVHVIVLSSGNVIRGNSIHDNWQDYQSAGGGAAIDLFGVVKYEYFHIYGAYGPGNPNWGLDYGVGANWPIPFLADLDPLGPPARDPLVTVPPLPAEARPMPNETRQTNATNLSNHFQTFPELKAASSAGNTTISFTLHSTPNKKFWIDFYANEKEGALGPDGRHYGEGQTFLGSWPAFTDASGNASATATFPTNLPAYPVVYLTATATYASPPDDPLDPNPRTGDTSEFSASLAVPSASVSPVTTENLQVLIDSVPAPPTGPKTVVLYATTDAQAAQIVDAINGLAEQVPPVTLFVDLDAGAFTGLTVSPPGGGSVVIKGKGTLTTITGHSPALTVLSGSVSVSDLTLTNATDAPTVLVVGGNLTLRNVLVQESTAFARAAIALTGGTVDLGTAASPGGNIININGAGELVHNTTASPVPAAGNSFALDGAPLASSSLSFTTLSSSATPSVYNQAVTFKATVRADLAGTGTPSGLVDFVDLSTNTDLGSATLAGGNAALTTSSLAIGGHDIRVYYRGDSTYLPSFDSLTQTVSQADTTTAVSPSANPSNFGRLLTLSVTVSAQAPGSGTPSGSVTFFDVSTATNLGSFDLTHGSAALSTAGLLPGNHAITVSYGGDPDFSSSSRTLTVSILASLLVLDATASGALTLSGNASIQVAGTVVVNSTSATAVSASGNARVAALQIDVTGGSRTTGNATLSPAPHTGVAPMADPLAGLALPAGGIPQGSVKVTSGTQTISPGVYTEIKVAGNGSLVLTPGIYIVTGGGFSVSGNGSVTGSGVLIYNAGSAFPNPGGTFRGITLSGNGVINLTAPATGPYARVLIFQARDNAAALSPDGQGALGLDGLIYAPAALLTLSGNSVLRSAMIVDRLTLTGNAAAALAAPASPDSLADTPPAVVSGASKAVPGNSLAQDVGPFAASPGTSVAYAAQLIRPAGQVGASQGAPSAGPGPEPSVSGRETGLNVQPTLTVRGSAYDPDGGDPGTLARGHDEPPNRTALDRLFADLAAESDWQTLDFFVP